MKRSYQRVPYGMFSTYIKQEAFKPVAEEDFKVDLENGKFYYNTLITERGKLLHIVNLDFNGYVQYFVVDYADAPRLSGGTKRIFRIHGKTYFFHRMVAQVWVPNPEQKPKVINDKPDVCWASMLRWVTDVEIRQEQREAGKLSNPRRHYGKYYDSLGGYVDNDGKFHEMSYDEYIDMIKKTRGTFVANRVIAKKKEYRENRLNRFK